jgi:hypothetical protein
VTAAFVTNRSNTNRYSVCAAARPSAVGILLMARTSSFAIISKVIVLVPPFFAGA